MGGGFGVAVSLPACRPFISRVTLNPGACYVQRKPKAGIS